MAGLFGSPSALSGVTARPCKGRGNPGRRRLSIRTDCRVAALLATTKRKTGAERNDPGGQMGARRYRRGAAFVSDGRWHACHQTVSPSNRTSTLDVHAARPALTRAPMPLSPPTVRRASALAAAFAWSTLVVQFLVSVETAASRGGGLGLAIVGYAGYFTIFTNAFAALVFTAGAVRRSGGGGCWRSSDVRAWRRSPSQASSSSGPCTRFCCAGCGRRRVGRKPPMWRSTT